MKIIMILKGSIQLQLATKNEHSYIQTNDKLQIITENQLVSFKLFFLRCPILATLQIFLTAKVWRTFNAFYSFHWRRMLWNCHWALKMPFKELKSYFMSFLRHFWVAESFVEQSNILSFKTFAKLKLKKD